MNTVSDKRLEAAWKKRLKLWAEAVLKVHGNITLEWRYNPRTRQNDCYLETGEIFKQPKGVQWR